MHGLVSLLDPERTSRVEEIWSDLGREFGLSGVSVTPFPHFSYQVARAYDPEKLETLMGEVARETAPFTILTSGLGVFAGRKPVLYVPVVRSPALSQLHERVWAASSPAGSGFSPYYEPARWMPHVTLAHGDLNAETLGEALRYLNGMNWDWTIHVDNLTLLYDRGSTHELLFRIPLGG